MVVASTIDDLLTTGVANPLTHSMRCAEVEGSALHLQNLARRNARLVNGDEEVGIDGQDVVQRSGVGLAMPASEKKPWLVMLTGVFLFVVPR